MMKIKDLGPVSLSLTFMSLRENDPVSMHLLILDTKYVPRRHSSTPPVILIYREDHQFCYFIFSFFCDSFVLCCNVCFQNK
ncbi:hypothetical protein FKM82_014598 [Ascaphus truei]